MHILCSKHTLDLCCISCDSPFPEHKDAAGLVLLHMLQRSGALSCKSLLPDLRSLPRHEDATGLVLLQMLQRGGARELAQLCAALIDVSAVTMACNAERALLRWELARGYPVGTVCIELIRCATWQALSERVRTTWKLAHWTTSEMSAMPLAEL